MRALLAFVSLCFTLVGALAQDIGFSPPISTAPQLVPSVSMSFTTGSYSQNCTPVSSCLTVSRASAVATDLVYTDTAGTSYTTYPANTLRIRSGRGILKEDNRTNFLPNSEQQTAQTTGSLATGTYALWINAPFGSYDTVTAGTATITFGGIYVGGQAVHGLPVVFTVTVAGTVNVTPTGTINQAQLELIGSGYPSSYLKTTGATVARGTESITPIGNLATVLSGTNGYVKMQVQGVSNGYAPLWRRFTHSEAFLEGGVGTLFASGNSVTVAATPSITNSSVILSSIGNTGAFNKFAMSWAPSGISVIASNGTLVHNSTQFTFPADALSLGGAQTSGSNNYFIPSLEVGNYTPSDSVILKSTGSWSPTFSRYLGDSITVGFLSTFGFPPQVMEQMPGGGQAFPYVDLGVNGTRAVTIAAGYQTNIAPFHDATIAKCVDFTMAGSNDLAGNFGAPSAEGGLTSIWAQGHAQGCLQVAITVISRGASFSNGATVASFEADRTILNSWIRANSSLYDVLVDLDLDPVFGSPTAYNTACSVVCYGQSFYYNQGADLTHPFQAGDYLIAHDIATAMSGTLY